MIKPEKNIINNKLIFRRRWPLNNYALQMTHQNIADNNKQINPAPLFKYLRFYATPKIKAKNMIKAKTESIKPFNDYNAELVHPHVLWDMNVIYEYYEVHLDRLITRIITEKLKLDD